MSSPPPPPAPEFAAAVLALDDDALRRWAAEFVPGLAEPPRRAILEYAAGQREDSRMDVAFGRAPLSVWAVQDGAQRTHVFLGPNHWIAPPPGQDAKPKRVINETWPPGGQLVRGVVVHAEAPSVGQNKNWVGVVLDAQVVKCRADGTWEAWFDMEEDVKGEDVDAAFVSASGKTVALALLNRETGARSVLVRMRDGLVMRFFGLRRVCGFVDESPLGVDVQDGKLRVVFLGMQTLQRTFGLTLTDNAEAHRALLARKDGPRLWVFYSSTLLCCTVDEAGKHTVARREDLCKPHEWARALSPLPAGRCALLLTTINPPADRVVVVDGQLRTVNETAGGAWPSALAGPLWCAPKPGLKVSFSTV